MVWAKLMVGTCPGCPANGLANTSVGTPVLTLPHSDAPDTWAAVKYCVADPPPVVSTPYTMVIPDNPATKGTTTEGDPAVLSVSVQVKLPPVTVKLSV